MTQIVGGRVVCLANKMFFYFFSKWGISTTGHLVLVGDAATTRFRYGPLYKCPTKNGHVSAPMFATICLNKSILNHLCLIT